MNMFIPMLDLPQQYNQLRQEINAAMQNVLDKGAYINGPQERQFEQHMEQFLGVKHALGVASGSDALLLSLMALPIRSGDKVIVPAFTFFATAGAVSRLGATPVFVDIDPLTYNLDINQAEDLLQNQPDIKAIIPVHVFGLPCDMLRIMSLAEKYNLYVIEDACQAINADVQLVSDHEGGNGPTDPGCAPVTAKAGTVGHTGCFSFFPSKNLGCYGDGGMVVTNDDDLAEKLRMLRVHGSRTKYYHQVVGCNSRLDTIQAAILDVKLKYLSKWTEKRRQVASIYNDEFRSHGLTEIVTCPEIAAGHVFHQYVIQTDPRDELAGYLKECGVDTAIYYPIPLHLQQCYQDLGYSQGDLPEAEKACRRVLALPIDPDLSSGNVSYIVQSIKRFMNDRSF
jgi:dTDP-4-amino-4,6-dideoxygalactose transaminase